MKQALLNLESSTAECQLSRCVCCCKSLGGSRYLHSSSYCTKIELKFSFTTEHFPNTQWLLLRRCECVRLWPQKSLWLSNQGCAQVCWFSTVSEDQYYIVYSCVIIFCYNFLLKFLKMWLNCNLCPLRLGFIVLCLLPVISQI